MDYKWLKKICLSAGENIHGIRDNLMTFALFRLGMHFLNNFFI